eukprot:gene5966-8220_t
MKPRKKNNSKINTVKSGIGLSGYDKAQSTPKESFITSRTMRVLLAGAGFLADAYDLFVINLVLRLLKDEYPEYANSDRIHILEGSVASSALIGSILGQLVAGSLADIIGRKKIFVATAVLITIGSFGSACSVDTPLLNVYGQISCWRFFLGTGVGGEYPLAATVTSESSSAARRGSLMAAVFAMQGVGSLISVIVVILCLGLGMSSGFTWRFALAFGAVPAMLAFPWRLRMHETESFERVKKERNAISQMANEQQYTPIIYYDNISSTSNMNSNHGQLSGNTNTNYNSTNNILNNSNHNGDSSQTPLTHEAPSNTHPTMATSRLTELSRAFKFYKYHMLGTALCWFLLDVDFYANGLFNHEVTSKILTHKGEHTTALQDAINSAILCLIGIPGYWLSVLYIDKVGRKNIQMLGFLVMATLFFILTFAYDWLLNDSNPNSHKKYLFLAIYALTFLFSNFGPNTTTFVIPGEIYPPEVRATCHGISAACGKFGAATGAYIFPLLLGPGGAAQPTNAGLKHSMFVCSIVALAGVLVTYLFIPKYGSDDLEDEDHYLQLEHYFLNPSPEEYELIDSYKKERKNSRSGGYEMVQVIESATDYEIGNEIAPIGNVLVAKGGYEKGVLKK